MGRNNLVAFHQFSKLPARDDIGNAAIFFNTAHQDLGNQLSVAIDEKFPVFQNAIVFSHVQHDKIPLRICHEHLAFKVRGQLYKAFGVSVNCQFVLRLLELLR